MNVNNHLTILAHEKQVNKYKDTKYINNATNEVKIMNTQSKNIC